MASDALALKKLLLNKIRKNIY